MKAKHSTSHKKREVTSIKVDPELWKKAKIEAINREIDLSELVEDALRKEIKGSSVTKWTDPTGIWQASSGMAEKRKELPFRRYRISGIGK